MTLWRTTLCLAAGAALLGACSKPGGDTAGGSAAASGGPDVTITQADLPRLKPGLWATSVSENGAAATTSQHCETGQQVGMAEMSKACSKFVFRRSVLGAITIDAVCGAGGYSSTMHMSVHGDFNSSLTGDAQISMTLPGRPPTQISTHTESHYVGPCPAGAQDE